MIPDRSEQRKSTPERGTSVKIINIGSMNIDYVYHMDHFIQPGETSGCQERTVGCGGKGLNQSAALARAGLPVCHAGIIGEEGRFLERKLHGFGVDTHLVETGRGAGGHAIIQVDRSGQNCIILYGGTNLQFSEDYIDRVLAELEKGDICVLQNEINNIPYIIERCSALGVRVAFNAAPYHDDVRAYPLEKVTWLIVNEVEGGGLSGLTEPDAIARCLAERYPDTQIVLTIGRDGSIWRKGADSVRCPAFCVDAVDTTAAGDTFIGYYLRAAADGWTPARALELASRASAIAVTRPGAADSVPTYEEVAQAELLCEGQR